MGYLDIHCWKALSLGIVQRPLKIWFIKEPVRKLHIKLLAFTAHFPLKEQGSFKVLSSACGTAYLERGQFAPKACINFAVLHYFKGKCLINWYREISGCVLRSLKDLCMTKSA